MNVLKPPEAFRHAARPTLFLSGSIEMGAAEDWQERLTKALADTPGTILNPRRDDWDSSWVQSIDNKPFREQVEWELQALEIASQIALYLSPGTKSPISLLELGLYMKSGKLIVYCPEGYWRKGNVDILCRHYIGYVVQVHTWEQFMEVLRGRMRYLDHFYRRRNEQ
jgi:hypothetical protein